VTTIPDLAPAPDGPLVLPAAPAHELHGDRKPGFGEALTTSMVSAAWTEDDGWQQPLVGDRRPLLLDAATVGLHYGQAVFEGLKAHRQPGGGLALFRPAEHARRMRASARRLAMPEPPEQLFLDAVTTLVRRDADVLPDDPALSLYVRPLLLATEPCLALRPARSYLFLVVAFVTAGFFSDRPDPVRVWVSDQYVRAAPGGTGAAKAAGNYAAGYPAQAAAAERDCAQVVWLDAVERRWVEEMGGMNLFFVRGRGQDAVLTTPPLTGTLLPGVTRDSLLTLGRDMGLRVREEQMELAEWARWSRDGTLTETFACGTAAVVTPVGTVCTATGSWTVGDGRAGPVTLALRGALCGIHRGTATDSHHWMQAVPS
jgi:branched-chain amino acid aminotransferase